ncbi:MAG TPA: hypothetical protein VMU96_13030, partial [Casimicrobiaceae bacterium]|nr:hypothetical protein [Casimicrobiaceae bacterium]
MLASLHPHDTEQMQRVEVPGSVREDLTVRGLGLRELAADHLWSQLLHLGPGAPYFLASNPQDVVPLY